MKKQNEKGLIIKRIELYLKFANIVKGSCFVTSADKGIESKNYFISVIGKNRRKYVLKIYSKNSAGEVEYEIEVLDKLNACFDKKYFPVISKRIFYINRKPCILLKYIHGRILSKNDISSSLIKKIARKQAEMHRALVDFSPRHKKNRFSIFDFSFVNIYLVNNKSSYCNLSLRNFNISLKS